MKNRTETACELSWCDLAKGHTDVHTGEADLPPVTATADRDVFERDRYAGILVPAVCTRLVAQTAPSAVHPKLSVVLNVRTTRAVCSAMLTIDEADLLRRHLTQLLQEVGR